jgi:hypothetical protein
MKSYLILLMALAAGVAAGQTSQPQPQITDPLLQAEPNISPSRERLLLLQPEKPNVISGRRFTFSGVTMQAVKLKNPLQLLNPLAPPEYSADLDNISWEPTTGKVTGLKFLSIKF